MFGAALRIGLRGLGNLSKGAGKLGKSAVKGTGSAIVGGAGGFLGGLFSGATGGKLGGEASNSNSGNGPSSTRGGVGSGGSFFGFSTSSNTRVNGPTTTKDNCCCCDQTLSLLSSIDETLKRSLYVSQRLGLQNSEMMAENANNQKIAGLGGSGEAARDSAEKVGFGLGQMILSSLALFVAGNAGKIFDPNRKADGEFDALGGAVGALAGGALGGKRKIVNAAIGGVTGSDILGDGVYKAKSEEGMIGGTVGNVGGALAGGMVGRGIGTAIGGGIGALFGGAGAIPGAMLGGFIGQFAGGILGSILTEDAGEAIGDSIAGKFNEEVNGKKFGEDAGKSFLNKTRDKINKIIISQGGTNFSPIGGTPGNSVKSLGQYISKYEANSDPNVYNKYDSSTGQYVAVSGNRLSDMSVNDIMTEQGVKSNNKSTNMFAVGKYQYTPDTLKDIVDRMKKQNIISGNEGFTEDLQDKIFEFSIMNDSKFENLRKYLAGDASATQAAMLEVAKEWRAIPDPRTGKTYGDSSSKYNQSQVSFREFSNFFDTLRPSNNTAGTAGVAASSPIPLMTPKTNTGQIDYFAIRDQPQKYAQPGQNTVMLPTPAPIMQPQKSPNVPYPVDGPRLPLASSQFPWGGGWVNR